MAKIKSRTKSDTAHAGSPDNKKYCATCGRLISDSHRNWAERKYCSMTCASPRSRPGMLDRRIESRIMELALSNEFRSIGVPVGIVQERCNDLFIQFIESSTRTTRANEDLAQSASPVPSEQELPEPNPDPDVDSSRAGMFKAAFRERVRRSGRRLVVFGDLSGADSTRFECLQGGRAVEPSFAKGEWSVKAVR